MILADTFAWVEYDRATGSSARRRLEGLIEADGTVAVTEPVVAWRRGATLLAHDAAMERLAHVIEVKLDEASLHA